MRVGDCVVRKAVDNGGHVTSRQPYVMIHTLRPVHAIIWIDGVYWRWWRVGLWIG